MTLLTLVASASPLPAPLTFLLLGAILIAILYRLSVQRPLPGIPHNRKSAYTFLGDIPAIRQRDPVHRREWFQQQPAKLGSPIVQVLIEPFRRPWLLIADFGETLELMTHHTHEIDRGFRAYEHFGGVVPNHHITMQMSDPRFKHNKELIRDLMTPAFLHEILAPQIHSKVSMLIDVWRLKAAAARGRPFTAATDVWGCTLDIITSVAFGFDDSQAWTCAQIAHITAATTATAPATTMDIAADERRDDSPCEFSSAPLNEVLDACVTLTGSLPVAMSSFVPILAHWAYRQTGKMRHARRVNDDMIRRQIDNSLRRFESYGSEPKPRCAMDQILLRDRSMANKTGRRPNPYSEVIRDELVGYVVAGHDSSSTTLSWFLKYMALFQPVQSRLREELRKAHADAFGESRQPSAAEIVQAHIPYLEAVLEETLRVCGTFPLYLRKTTCDMAIFGYHVPAGTNLIFSTQGPSYKTPSAPIDEWRRSDGARGHKARYGEWASDTMASFLPERWLRAERDERTGEDLDVFDPMAGPSLPFSAGPRGCFGRRLATLELKIAFTLLVWAFEFQLLPDAMQELEGLDLFTTQPKTCFVRLRAL